MDSSFKRWLTSSNVSAKTIKALQKEDIVDETTLKCMRDTDLESLKEKYRLQVGQLAVLRGARDDLINTETEDLAGDHEPLIRRKTGDSSYEQSRAEKNIKEKYKLPRRDDKYSKWRDEQSKAATMPTFTDTQSHLPKRSSGSAPGSADYLPVSVLLM